MIASNIAPKKWNLNSSSSDSTSTDLTASFNDDAGSMASTQYADFYIHPQVVNGIQWVVSYTDFAVNITNSSGITASAAITQDGTKVKIRVSYSGTFPSNNSTSTITITSGSAYQTQQ